MRRQLLTFAFAASLPLLASCAADDDTPRTLAGPAAEPEVASLFVRYVALGNSITAGYQSGGINDSTQRRSYPVMLATQAGFGATFGVPALAAPGCPPPLVAPFSPARVGGGTPTTCALRTTPAPRFVQNLAVPGAAMASAMDMTVAANVLTTLVLGGQTPEAAMRAANPTMVSVWLGNNDALGAALTGDVTRLTPLATFTASLDALVASIQQTPAGRSEAVVLIGVVDPRLAPALQPGMFAWFVKQNPQTAPLLPQTVADNCAPTTPTGQQNLVSLQVTTSGLPVISCANDAPFVLTPAEQQQISERVAAFNSAIQQRAQANGWIYVDPNALLQPFLAQATAIRKCQGLPAALQTGDPAQIQQAIVTTCPSPDPAAGFGTLISHDGVHPSTAGHRVVTNEIIARLNTKFGVQIPAMN
jgi:hypothetical protein